MTPLKRALICAEQVPVFPCVAGGPAPKRPHTPRGFLDASRDRAIITAWWGRWPKALKDEHPELFDGTDQ